MLDFLRDRAAAGQPLPGFAYSLANAVPANLATVVGKLPTQVKVRLLLPDLDLLPRAKPPKKPVHPYSNAVPPLTWTAAQAAPWLLQVATPQVQAGASAVITPSPLLEPSDGEVELRRVLEWADVIRGLKITSGLPVITGLTLHRHWLADDTKRETLLNVLTDADDPAFLFVVRWPVTATYGQIVEEAALRGYREVLSVLRRAAREVIAARNGLASLLTLGSGAAATVAGIYPSHLHRDPVTIRRAKGSKSPPRIPHYLDGKLLSYVPAARLAAVDQVSGPAQCACAYCVQLRSQAPYDDTLGFKHLLALHTELAIWIGTANSPRAAARRRVDDALSLGGTQGLGLPSYATAHLQTWRDVLS